MDAAAASAIVPSDPRLVRCGFAKLQGDGIEFFMRKYEITMGRSSKNSTLDLVLGDSTTISRQHASIRYNFDNKCFELVVLGKNGVQVDSRGETHVYTPDSPPTPLRSRDLLLMGEKRFYFLLPRSMGGPARKRRRTEPSPAPPPVASMPAATAAAQRHPQVAAAPSQLPLHQPQQQLPPAPAQAQASAPAPGVGAAVLVAGGPAALPAHAPATAPPAPQAPDALAPPPQQSHPHPHEQSFAAAGTGAAGVAAEGVLDDLGGGTTGGGLGGQDEEDALINAGGPLVYDNGVTYGYGGDPNGFAGGF